MSESSAEPSPCPVNATNRVSAGQKAKTTESCTATESPTDPGSGSWDPALSVAPARFPGRAGGEGGAPGRAEIERLDERESHATIYERRERDREASVGLDELPDGTALETGWWPDRVGREDPGQSRIFGSVHVNIHLPRRRVRDHHEGKETFANASEPVMIWASWGRVSAPIGSATTMGAQLEPPLRDRENANPHPVALQTVEPRSNVPLLFPSAGDPIGKNDEEPEPMPPRSTKRPSDRSVPEADRRGRTRSEQPRAVEPRGVRRPRRRVDHHLRVRLSQVGAVFDLPVRRRVVHRFIDHGRGQRDLDLRALLRSPDMDARIVDRREPVLRKSEQVIALSRARRTAPPGSSPSSWSRCRPPHRSPSRKRRARASRCRR
jgi:hypothetical protein